MLSDNSRIYEVFLVFYFIWAFFTALNEGLRFYYPQKKSKQKPMLFWRSVFVCLYSGNPEKMSVMTEKNPNTPTVPSEKIIPNTFLFFKELIKPNTARIATKLKMIAVPIY